MTVVRITIKKNLTESAYSYGQSALGPFSSEYLVRTDASFPSPQLKEYAIHLATAESRLYPACVRFESAHVKLATPGLSPEELRGQFPRVALPTFRGQLAMGEEDALAFPPVVGVYGRVAQWGRHGRLLIPHALTAAEWNLYTQKQVVPLRFQKQNANSLAPSSIFSHELIEAVRGSNGTHVMPNVLGDTDQRLRPIRDFFFLGFQVNSLKAKRKKARRAAQRPALSNKGAKSQEAVAGVVYLLKGGPFFKIGKSIDFEKRLGQIKLQIPYAVEVVHVIRAAHPLQAEAHWHRRFASLRQNGEWFLLSQAEVDEFKSVSNM